MKTRNLLTLLLLLTLSAPVMAQSKQSVPQKPQTPPPTMDVDDAARSVLHMASLPPEANVLFMTVMATTMPYVGRG